MEEIYDIFLKGKKWDLEHYICSECDSNVTPPSQNTVNMTLPRKASENDILQYILELSESVMKSSVSEAFAYCFICF